MKKVEFKGVAMNPVDNWVCGSLLWIKDSTTEKESCYITDGYSKVEVDQETIRRKVYEWDGVKYFDGDIIEFDDDGLRRIEPIIDDGLMVYVGRSRNDWAYRVLQERLNIKIIGNTIENPELLKRNWDKIS